MKKYWGRISLSCCLSALICVVLTSCLSSQAAPDRKIVLTGSSTIAPLALELAKAYEKSHPDIRIDVQTGGSSRGIADARRGLADVGMVSRDLKPSESDLHAHPIALDGVCLIVHKTNPVKELTRPQILAIYTGKTRNWKEVGGPDATITVVNKAEGHSTLELFLKHFKLKNTDIRADVVIGDNEQGVKTVAGNRHAIGYVSIGTAEYDAQHGTDIKLLPLNGVKASTATVRDKSFPLMRTLNFVTTEKPTDAVKQFLDFAQSKDAHAIVRRQSFVPLAK